MVAKIHPEPQPEGESKSPSTEPPTAQPPPSEDKKEEEDKSDSPIEFINVNSAIPEPKSPSKPRQKGIGLDNFRSLSFLQIRQTNRHMEDFANVQNNYDVEKSNNPQDKLFFGIECTAPDVRVKVQSSTMESQPFALRLIDRDDGSELMEIDRQGLNSTPTMVYRFRLKKKETVGAIVLQYGWRKLTPTFTIFDQDGNGLMKLVGPAPARTLGKVAYSKETTFVVYRGDGDQGRIATVIKPGDIFEENKNPSTEEEIIRINYEDRTVDDLWKALILCTAFVLDYTQFKPPSNVKKLTSLLCFTCM